MPSPRATISRRSLILLGFLALSGSACGGRQINVAAPSAPEAQSAQWISDALGSAPDYSLMARPMAVRSDPYWGPLLARLMQQRDSNDAIISRASGGMVLTSQQIDMYIVDRGGQGSGKSDLSSVGWLGIVYGLAPLDPSSLRMGGGRPIFGAPMRLVPSGVTMFPPDGRYMNEFGPISPTLFLTPSGIAVVTDQQTARRIYGMLTANSFVPPALVAPADSLGGGRVAVTSLRFLGARANDRAHYTQGLTAAAVGVRGGQNGAIEIVGDYATTEDAERGYVALQRACANRGDGCLINPSEIRDATASRDGSQIFVKLALSDKVLRTIQQAGGDER